MMNNSVRVCIVLIATLLALSTSFAHASLDVIATKGAQLNSGSGCENNTLTFTGAEGKILFITIPFYLSL